MRYYYRAEEGGNELYETNDSSGVFYPERYHALYVDDKEDYFEEWFETPDKAVAWINEQSGLEFKSIQEIDNHYTGSDVPYCEVHEVDIISHDQDLLTRAIVKTMKIEKLKDGEFVVNYDLSKFGFAEDYEVKGLDG